MSKNIKRIIKNKYFFIFALLILIMLPSTLYMSSDKDDTIIITTIGIDKEDNQYNLTAFFLKINILNVISLLYTF